MPIKNETKKHLYMDKRKEKTKYSGIQKPTRASHIICCADTIIIIVINGRNPSKA